MRTILPSLRDALDILAVSVTIWLVGAGVALVVDSFDTLTGQFIAMVALCLITGWSAVAILRMLLDDGSGRTEETPRPSQQEGGQQ